MRELTEDERRPLLKCIHGKASIERCEQCESPTPEEILEKRVRDSAQLIERLQDIRKRVGDMCSNRHGPKMTIPVAWYDDDFFISTTVKDAIDVLNEIGVNHDGQPNSEPSESVGLGAAAPESSSAQPSPPPSTNTPEEILSGPPFTVDRYGSLGATLMAELEWTREMKDAYEREVKELRVLHFTLKEEIAGLKYELASVPPDGCQLPIGTEYLLVDDMDEGFDPRYGKVLIATRNCVKVIEPAAPPPKDAHRDMQFAMAREIISGYAARNPKHVYGGVEQDPLGAHAWLERNKIGASPSAAPTTPEARELPTPTNKGTRRCLEFIADIKRIGWASKDIPALVDLWWKYRDGDGNLVGEAAQPQDETTNPQFKLRSSGLYESRYKCTKCNFMYTESADVCESINKQRSAHECKSYETDKAPAFGIPILADMVREKITAGMTKGQAFNVVVRDAEGKPIYELPHETGEG